MRSQKAIKQSATFLTSFLRSSVVLLLITCWACFSQNFALSAEPGLDVNPDLTETPIIKSSTPRTKIYFYNPEINTARNLVLKNTWDSYLHEKGNFEFQPVENGEDFSKLVHQESNAAFIMAEWLYSELFAFPNSDKHNVQLAFRGIKNGEDTYKKILVSNKGALDFEKVTIACSGSKARAREVIKSIYPELSSQQLEALKILLVPKDIDALMAVGYGLAEMALSTELSLSKMSLLNNNLYKDMIVLKESSPLRRSVLIFKSTNSELKASLANALLNMKNHSQGKKALTLLGLDEWKVTDKLVALSHSGLMDEENKKGGQNNDN